jgi:hypothetical protein
LNIGLGMQQADPPSIPPQQRQLGDERSRYGRKTVRDQAGELIDTLRGHPVAIGLVVLAFAIGAGLWLLSGRPVKPGELAIGDCLYVPIPSSIGVSADQPIGQPADVEAVLMTGGAETAPCTGAHGHEVSSIVGLQVPRPSGFVETQVTLRAYAQTACEQAFPGYVGHPLAGSAYITFAAVPTIDAWNAGQGLGVCLVARADGQWMNHPARGSGG